MADPLAPGTYARAEALCDSDTIASISPSAEKLATTGLAAVTKMQKIEALNKTSLEMQKIIAENSETIPSATLKKLWETMNKQVFDKSFFVLYAESNALGNARLEDRYQMTQTLMSRFRELINDLYSQKKIRYLTSENRKNLGVSDDDKLRAFYLPLTNHIFLDQNLSEDEQARSLFHELFHSMQYAYRLPLDVAHLQKLASEKKIEEKDLNEFLSYYYESQANFQTMKYKVDDNWKKIFQEKSSEVRGGAAAVGAAMLGPLGIPLLMGSVGLSNSKMNEYLSEVDQVPWYGSRRWSGEKAALGLMEFVPIKNSDTMNLTSSTYDLNFHKQYGQAIEQAYFQKKLSFLFKDNREDLRIFNALNNQYYSLLGASKVTEKDQGCKRILEKVRREGHSPLIQWLSISKDEMKECSVYKTAAESDFQTNLLEHAIKESSEDSPFHLRRADASGTGSRPELTLVPIQIQPQLLVKPNEDEAHE